MSAIETRETFINEARIPAVLEVTSGHEAAIDEVVSWVTASRPRILELMQEHGAVMLRGLRALEGAQDFDRVVRAVSPKLMDYVGGTSPRQIVHGQIVPSTELAPEASLPLPQETVYTDNPPDMLAFFSVAVATTGGETTLGDMAAVLRDLPPDLVERFQRGGVRLRRALPPRARVAAKAGVAKPWEEVFQTDDVGEAERIAKERGWLTRRLPDDFLQVAQELRPATTKHPATGTSVWYNQAHIFAPTGSAAWARRDGRGEDAAKVERLAAAEPEMVDQVLHDDGSTIPASDIEIIWKTLIKNEIKVAWQPRDVLFIDNILVSHGRLPFTGPRKLLAALMRR